MKKIVLMLVLLSSCVFKDEKDIMVNDPSKVNQKTELQERVKEKLTGIATSRDGQAGSAMLNVIQATENILNEDFARFDDQSVVLNAFTNTIQLNSGFSSLTAINQVLELYCDAVSFTRQCHESNTTHEILLIDLEVASNSTETNVVINILTGSTATLVNGLIGPCDPFKAGQYFPFSTSFGGSVGSCQGNSISAGTAIQDAINRNRYIPPGLKYFNFINLRIVRPEQVPNPISSGGICNYNNFYLFSMPLTCASGDFCFDFSQLNYHYCSINQEVIDPIIPEGNNLINCEIRSLTNGSNQLLAQHVLKFYFGVPVIIDGPKPDTKNFEDCGC